jgi:hypothetical protein
MIFYPRILFNQSIQTLKPGKAFYYFWRTYDQQEIDWVEDKDGKLAAFEIKWKMSKEKVPAAWKKAYPDADYKVINRENYCNGSPG